MREVDTFFLSVFNVIKETRLQSSKRSVMTRIFSRRSVAILEARVQELSLDVSANQQDYEQKLVEEKAMAREMTAKLAREVGRYEKELGDLNVFISKKNELERELEETRAELFQERRKHEQIIGELERKTVQEKERLRREMEHKIQEAKEAFMRLTDDQLEATTKRTMRENEQMAAELAYQSRETERLLLRNAKLVEENRSVRRELALHRQTEAEMARRNHAYLRTIRGLLGKLKALDAHRRDLERQGREREESEATQYKQRAALLQETVEDALRQLDEVRTSGPAPRACASTGRAAVWRRRLSRSCRMDWVVSLLLVCVRFYSPRYRGMAMCMRLSKVVCVCVIQKCS